MSWKKITAAALFCLAVSGPGFARMQEGAQTSVKKLSALAKVALPNDQQCTHRTGRLWFTVTNYGFFGNQSNPAALRDCLTGGLSSSAEFPGGTNIEYLFQGALWIGAIVGEDTLVSVGSDGWSAQSIQELWPDQGAAGDIIKRSINKSSPYFSEQAVSDMDMIAVLYDTLTDASIVAPDPTDGRPHLPIGLKIIQNSYSWASGWGQDWVMLDYKIINLGRRPIRKIYVGVFVDGDVGHTGTPTYWTDDLSGFKVSVPNELFPNCPDTINLAYIQDDDGQSRDTDRGTSTFTSVSPTGVTGVRVVRTPLPPSQVKTSFNWWTPNGQTSLDWGPQKVTTTRKNRSGGLGQPEGDAMKYSYLSNGEFDYDQLFSAVNQTSTGWISPLSQTNAIDVANGYDTRYLVSFGEFNLFEGDTLPITMGYIAGEGFHKDPKNWIDNLGFVPANYLDTTRINAFQRGLDFSAVANNARWVQRVFDNENQVDTVICGGSKVERFFGDGIPDFRGPLPPPAPETLSFISGLGEVTVRWFGKNSETSLDSFSRTEDFEGYRILTSSDNVNFTMVGSFDRVDWKPMFFNCAKGRWAPAPGNPMTFDQIQQYYGQILRDSLGDPNFVLDPERYNSEGGIFLCNNLPRWKDTTKSSIPIRFGKDNRGRNIDTVFIFVKQDFNLGLKNIQLYPDSTNDFKYWYQYKLTGLFPSQPVYIAVTPFDFGFLTPNQFIDPQEAQPTNSSKLVYALPTDQQRQQAGLKISAYPNPYRVDQDYSFFEKPSNPENPESVNDARRINFINLPASCILRIYSVDGDLVQEIKHEKDPGASDAGFGQWDLKTRNNQRVTAGLYLYTVQPTGAYAGEQTHIGKLVIIK